MTTDLTINYLQHILAIAFEECCLPEPVFSSCLVASSEGLLTVITASQPPFELAVGIPEEVEGMDEDVDPWDGGVVVTFKEQTKRIPINNLIDTLQELKDKGIM